MRIDSTSPTAAALTPAANAKGWRTSAVNVTLNAADQHSGVAARQYRLQGAGTWTTNTVPFAITTQGAGTWQYRSLDSAGNAESAQSFTVRIDSRKPTTRAYKATVKRGGKVKLRYRIGDPLPGCGEATVKLRIYKGKKLKKTPTVKGTRACSVTRSCS